MARAIPESRKADVAKNLRRLIKDNPNIRTITRFAELHGCDVRTAKWWVKNGIDRLTTISEVAYTLGVSDLELIIGNDD